MLAHAHREVKRLAAGVAIYWRYGRGAGSVPLASFKAPTLADAEALEAQGATELAEAWLAAHKPLPPLGTLSGMCAGFQASPKFARMAASTQMEWRRCLDIIRDDIGTMSRRDLERPNATAALIDWRDRYADTPERRTIW